RPYGSVTTKERSAGAFFATKAQRSIEQSGYEPFESYWYFDQSTPDPGGHAVDDAAADRCFAYGRILLPLRTMHEEIINRRRQVVIGVHQARLAGDDAVPVTVGVVAESNVEAIFERDQFGHRIRR